MHKTVPVGQDAEAVLENAASTEEDKAEANAGGERLEGGVEAAQQSAPLAVQLRLTKGVAGNCRKEADLLYTHVGMNFKSEPPAPSVKYGTLE